MRVLDYGLQPEGFPGRTETSSSCELLGHGTGDQRMDHDCWVLRLFNLQLSSFWAWVIRMPMDASVLPSTAELNLVPAL